MHARSNNVYNLLYTGERFISLFNLRLVGK